MSVYLNHGENLLQSISEAHQASAEEVEIVYVIIRASMNPTGDEMMVEDLNGRQEVSKNLHFKATEN